MGRKPPKLRGKVGRPRRPRHHADYAAVGKKPADTLEGIKWAADMLMVSMEKIANDPNIQERERRAELRSTAKLLPQLVSYVRLLEAEQTVRRHYDAMTETRADPGVEDVEGSIESEGPLRIDPEG